MALAILLVLSILGLIWIQRQNRYLQQVLRPIIGPIIQADYAADLVWFNPLNAQITMLNVKAFAPGAPADPKVLEQHPARAFRGRPVLAAAKKIIIDIDLAPLASGQIYFPLIKIEQPRIFWLTDAQGHNLTLDYLGKLLFPPPPPSPPPPLPNFVIKKIVADDLKVVGDARQIPPGSWSVEVDNLIGRAKPEDWPNRVRVRQTAASGPGFELEAKANLLSPIAKMDGQIKSRIKLEDNPYLWESWLGRPAGGGLSLDGDFSLTSRPNCRLKFEGRNIGLKDETGEFVSLPKVAGRAEFTWGGDLLIEDWQADDLFVRTEIGADNSLNLTSVLKPEPPPQPGQGPPVMKDLVLSRGRINRGRILIDRQLGKDDALSLDLVNIKGTIDQGRSGAATRFDLSGQSQGSPGTTLRLNGRLRLPPDGIYLDTQLTAAQVPLALGPLFWGRNVLPPLTGALAVNGSLKWQPDLFGLDLQVEAANCRVANPAGFRHSYLLKTDRFSADLDLAIAKKTRLALDNVILTRPTMIVEINPAGKNNLLETLGAPASAAGPSQAENNFSLAVSSVAAQDGELVLADHKYADPPLIFRLDHVRADLINLTNQPGPEPFKFDLHGTMLLSPDSLIAVRGRIKPASALDLELLFTVRNLRLFTLEPYLTKDAADLSRTVLDLASQLDCQGNKLSGENFISLKNIQPAAQTSSNLVFGVPARTLFNFLKDSEGRLEFSFHTSGTIDHPQFDLAQSLQAKLGARIGQATTDTGVSIMGLPSTILGLPNFLLQESGKMLGVDEEEE